MHTNTIRTALVTGGSRGIGAAIARRLTNDGFNVAITYVKSRDAADRLLSELKNNGFKSAAFKADAADVNSMSWLVDRVIEHFGRLDVLVNNAGIFETATLTDATDEDFSRMIDVNVRSVFLVSRAAARVMPEGGRIINIGSIVGDRVPFAGGSLYAMSKAAVSALAKGWARDLAPKGITVNCVQPGPIDTDMNPATGDSAEFQSSMTSLGRYGRVDEVASLVSFLAGTESSYVTGASINVDGGFNA